MPIEIIFVVVLCAAALVLIANHALQPPTEAVALQLEIIYPEPGATTMKISEQVILSIAPVDADGIPAPVTDIKWAVRPADVTAPPDAAGTVTPDASGHSALYVPAIAGTVIVSVMATTFGGVSLSDEATIEVLPGEAVTLQLSVGKPTPR